MEAAPSLRGHGTWDRVLGHLLPQADAPGELDWTMSVDATIIDALQHATNLTRPEPKTAGRTESRESVTVAR